MTGRRSERGQGGPRSARSIDELARRVGIEQLRPGQRDAIEAILGGHDVLAVMATGYGKSAVYQIATLALGGTAVVVSPLIALQRDQVEGIVDRDVGEAIVINSNLATTARQRALEHVASGDVPFVFLAPEQLARDDTMDALRRAEPALFVVDESHCITWWGHDFRPDYLGLADAVEALGHPRVVALTATAAPPVQAEIVERLGMIDPQVVITGFDRPNLHLSAEVVDDARERDELVADRALVLSAGHRSGIVYTATRRRAEELAEAIRRRGGRATAYHAGLPRAARDRAQSDFMGGTVDIVVATVAFGMGIDKPDVRFVLHADAPDSLDSYHQEIGRAGRNGRPADVQLFFRRGDLGLQRYLSAGGAQPEVLLEVVEVVAESDHELSVEEVSEQVELSDRQTTRAVTELETLDLVAVDRRGTVTPNVGRDRHPSEEIRQLDEARRQWASSRLEMVAAYAETRSCRRRFLLTYFGETAPPTCSACDNCEAGRSAVVEAAQEADDRPFPEQAQVAHAEWGDGRVIRAEGDSITVLFDDVGYKVLSCHLVVEHDLLRRLDDR
jgi:ATP-dependent DNA helicase RecQ